jgi:hypothetical protein
MSDIYVMQRANRDVFALDDHGRFGVPIFHSSRDAMIARSRNWGLLLFKPVALEAALLKELVPLSGGNDVDFWLVDDPSISLKRGRVVQGAQLGLLVGSPIELPAVRRRRNSVETPSLSTFATSNIRPTEVWEDEGGLYSKCA